MDDDKMGARSLTRPEATSPPLDRMLVRQAGPADFAGIIDLVTHLELDYPAMELPRFFVAEIDGSLLAAAELKPFTGFALLSCVGVREELQGAGLGRALVSQMLERVRTDVYLYTLVPGFFEKLGFVEATAIPADLPPRAIYGCLNCDPTRCRCMVRTSNVS